MMIPLKMNKTYTVTVTISLKARLSTALVDLKKDLKKKVDFIDLMDMTIHHLNDFLDFIEDLKLEHMEKRVKLNEIEKIQGEYYNVLDILRDQLKELDNCHNFSKKVTEMKIKSISKSILMDIYWSLSDFSKFVV